MRRHVEFVDRQVDRHVVLQGHQLQRDPRLVREFQQVLAALVLFDLAGARQQGFEITVLVDQQRRRLHPDARHPRHVVDRIAGQRLYLDDLLGPDAEALDHLGRADAAVLHLVEHRDLVVDQLHQVLVRGDDGNVGARRLRLFRIGRDDVVGLVALDLDGVQVEGLARLADQGELRHQLLRRVGAVALVIGIDVVAEIAPRGVEDDGDMIRIGIAQQLHQHPGETEDRVDRRAVGAGQRADRVEGPEDEAGAVDQIEMFEGRRLGHAGIPASKKRALKMPNRPRMGKRRCTASRARRARRKTLSAH